MGVLLRITTVKSCFGGKYLVNKEYRHKKHFSLILMVSRSKNSEDPKIEPTKMTYLFSFQI